MPAANNAAPWWSTAETPMARGPCLPRACDGRQARHCLNNQILSRPIDVGAVCPKARRRRVDDIGLNRSDIVIAEAQFRHDAGTIILGDHIRVGDQFAGDGNARGILQVQSETALVPAASEVERCLSVDKAVRAAPFSLERHLQPARWRSRRLRDRPGTGRRRDPSGSG